MVVVIIIVVVMNGFFFSLSLSLSLSLFLLVCLAGIVKGRLINNNNFKQRKCDFFPRGVCYE